MRRRLLLLFAAATAVAVPAAFGGSARVGTAATARTAAPAPAAVRTARCPVPAAYRGVFVHAARSTGLPLALLVAVAKVESRFDPQAHSTAGAEGILQLLPSTAAALRADPQRVDSNVVGGARYLRQLLDRFESPDLALAAYNAGPSAVERAGGAPTAETLTYVANVTALWRALRGCR